MLRAPRPDHPSLDLIVPVLNEQEIVRPLVERLRSAFSDEERARAGLGRVRFLFVDDGSTDATAALLADEIARGFPAVLYRLSRNFGHQNALAAGIDHADADLVAIIDADLQDPPEVIPSMVERWRRGADVVYGRRRKRRENPVKVACYWLFYRLVALLADIQIPLDSGDFCLMDRRVVLALRAVPEKLRFMRGLRAWVGFSQDGFDYDRPARQAGSSKYGLGRLYRLATDGVVSSSIRPLQIAQFFSLSYLVLALVLGLLLLLRPQVLDVPPALLVVYLLVVSGNFVQVFCVYILGAYVGRTYLEAKGRPSYVVMEVVTPVESEGG